MEMSKKQHSAAEDIVTVDNKTLQRFKDRGYNEDVLPKTADKRNMNKKNYFTLWMGAVHNIPNYTAVGGFLFLGLSPINVILAIIISSLVVSAFMVYNGRAGSKYGIPFAMQLRSTYGVVGSKLPGFLRGCIAAIAWFGLQTYTGALALVILLGKLWPGFLDLGGDFSFFGIDMPGLIAFSLLWIVNVLIGLGGGGSLNKFTAVLNPLIYLVFGGMTIWAINVAGGIGNILSYTATGSEVVNHPAMIGYLIIISSIIAVWAAPGSSVSDFTQNATSTKDQAIGQTASLVVAYLIFAFSSVFILIGGSLHFGVQEWNVLNIVNKWDSLPAIIIAVLVLLMTTISTNSTSNIIPAAYQLSALFPKKINYKRGVWIASIIGFLIMPWKLMENPDSIFIFLNTIGALLGPVAGVMLAQYYIVDKQQIDLDALYMEKGKNQEKNPYKGINIEAYIATIVALVASLIGQFVPALSLMSDLSWFIGAGLGFGLYALLKLRQTNTREEK